MKEGYQDQIKHVALVSVVAVKQTPSIPIKHTDTWNPNLDQRTFQYSVQEKEISFPVAT